MSNSILSSALKPQKFVGALELALNRKVQCDSYPPYFATKVESLDGVRFLFSTNGEYLEEINSYQIAKAASTISPATRATRSSALKVVLSFFADNQWDWKVCTELAHINLMHFHYRSAQVQSNDGEKRARVSKTTWNQWAVHWLQFIAYAESQGWVEPINFELADVVERGKSDPNIGALLPSEFRDFMRLISEQRLRAGVNVMVGTGIRAAENASLKLRDIPKLSEFSGSSYRPRNIIGKGAKKREILWPLSAAKSVWAYVHLERSIALNLLRNRIISGERNVEGSVLKFGIDAKGNPMLEERSDAELWLTEDGEALSIKRWSKDFEKVQVDKETRITPHQLRHTYAVVTLSNLIKQQIKIEIAEMNRGSSQLNEYFRSPLEEVRARLGHSSIKTTMVYLNHISEYRHLMNQAILDMERDFLDA